MQRFRDGFTAIPPMRSLGEHMGPRRGRSGARGVTAGQAMAARTSRARRRFQLHAGARSRLWRQHGDRRPRLPSQSERRGASRGGAASTACARAAAPRSASIFRDMVMSPPIRTRRCRSTSRTFAAIAAADLVPFARTGARGTRGGHAGARGLSGGRCEARRLFTHLVAGHPARRPRIRRPRLFRRPRHGWRTGRRATSSPARTPRLAPAATWC